MPQVEQPTIEPTPLELPKAKIWSLAEDIATLIGYAPGAPLDPIVYQLGGKIIYQDMDDWYNTEDGSIVVTGEGEFCIYISNFTGPLRNRFTIAHEIGHYILHSNLGKIHIKVARFTNKKTNRVEWEANWFAAAFLMPASKIIQDYSLIKDRDILSAKYLVSKAALGVRLNDLGL